MLTSLAIVPKTSRVHTDAVNFAKHLVHARVDFSSLSWAHIVQGRIHKNSSVNHVHQIERCADYAEQKRNRSCCKDMMIPELLQPSIIAPPLLDTAYSNQNLRSLPIVFA